MGDGRYNTNCWGRRSFRILTINLTRVLVVAAVTVENLIVRLYVTSSFNMERSMERIMDADQSGVGNNILAS